MDIYFILGLLIRRFKAPIQAPDGRTLILRLACVFMRL